MNYSIALDVRDRQSARHATASPSAWMIAPNESHISDKRRQFHRDIERLAHRRAYRAGETILGEDEPVSSVGMIVSGVLRIQKNMPHGRQQIVGLLYPSDMFGRVFSHRGKFAIEAATDASVCGFERKKLELLLRDHPEFEHQMFLSALDQLDRTREWMVLLGAPTVPKRIAGFLRYLASRQAETGANSRVCRNPNVIEILISRRDVAAFLGTTVESICRALGKMEQEKIIRKIGRRQIEILDDRKLSEILNM